MCGGKQVPLVPFVEAIVRDTVLGLVGSLKGVDAGAEITVRIGPRNPSLAEAGRAIRRSVDPAAPR